MKKILAVLLGAAVAMGAMAIPAKPGPIVITDSEGVEHTVTIHGDEFFHYMTDTKGNWVEMLNGKLTEVPAMTEEEIMVQRTQQKMQRAPRRVAEQTMTAVPLNIAPRGVIILANFSDVTFQAANDLAAMTDMYDGDNYTDNGATGSARKYFHDQSYGQYNPEFDIVGPVTLSKTQQYYGQNNGNYTDVNAYEMIIEACQLADQECNVDFSKYDNNKDGVIDFVYVVYAGKGEADGGGANTIWPHTSQISYYGTVTLDGKKLDTYACSNELQYSVGNKLRNGIGAFCHEFSHVLGLPDFYNSANPSSATKLTGDWDIMCSGSYNNKSMTPAGYNAYERFFMGWSEPVLLNAPNTLHMAALAEGGKSYIITSTGESNLKGNNPNPETFFIVENRQKTGWDKYVPGHGMLIYKVQYSYNKWIANSPNNLASKMGVDIIEADGKTTTTEGKQGDCFPYGTTDFYTPYDAYPITRIKETDEGEIVFDFMGGADYISSLAQDCAADKYGTDFTEVVAVYDLYGHKVITESPFNDLIPGFYIVAVTNGTKTKGIKIIVR